MSDLVVRLTRDKYEVILGVRSGAELTRELLQAVGNEALAVVHQAYLLKGHGNTDAAGIWWPPRQRPDKRPVRRTVWGRKVIPARRVQVDPRPIGIRTGRLVTSLEPDSGSVDQVFDLGPNMVRIGSRVPYAGNFAYLRPIFPTGPWPEEWLERLGGAITERLAALLVRGMAG